MLKTYRLLYSGYDQAYLAKLFYEIILHVNEFFMNYYDTFKAVKYFFVENKDKRNHSYLIILPQVEG